MENINIIWKVNNIVAWPSLGTLTNVAYMIEYKVASDNPPLRVGVEEYNSIVLPPPDESTFIPYDQLTEEQVVQWVKTALGPVSVSKLESELWHRYMIYRSVVHADEVVAGETYQIDMVGDTDWTLIGAAENKLGVVFTATGPGTGTGLARGTIPLYQPSLPWTS